MRQARLRMGIPQDKLGVQIGLDEAVASARISRYETGINQPPLNMAKAIAEALEVPLGYLFCDDDRLAEIIVVASELSPEEQEALLQHLRTKTIKKESDS